MGPPISTVTPEQLLVTSRSAAKRGMNPNILSGHGALEVGNFSPVMVVPRGPPLITLWPLPIRPLPPAKPVITTTLVVSSLAFPFRLRLLLTKSRALFAASIAASIIACMQPGV